MAAKMPQETKNSARVAKQAKSGRVAAKRNTRKSAKPPRRVTKDGAAERTGAKTPTTRKTAPKSRARKAAKPVLLAGDNPQIAKAEGDAPVQAYIAAIPGWKRAVAHRLDALVVRAVPGVRKAVKWNSPFYGVDDRGWFLNLHCFTNYVKVAFFRGTSLRPVPPGESKSKEVRYLDVYQDDEFDEAQFTSWVKQASELPGERM